MSGGGAAPGPAAGAAAPPRVPFRGRTRLVAWAKVLLPLAALALLSTLFLLSREGAGPSDIPFAEIEAIAREPRIDAPRLAGLAPDGTAVELTADRLLPVAGQPDGFRALEPRLATRAPDGLAVRASAPEAEGLGPTRTLRLLGRVAVEAASPAAGTLSVRTGPVTADLATGVLTALEGVEADSRLGRLTARTMRIEQGEPGVPPRVVFNGSVRLVYRPGPAPEGVPEPAPEPAPADPGANPGARPGATP